MIIIDDAVAAAKTAIFSSVTQGSVGWREALEKALELDPDDPLTLLAMGLLLYNEGKLQDAADHLWRAAAADPCDYQPFLCLTGVLRDLDAPAALRSGVMVLGMRKALENEEKARAEMRKYAAKKDLPDRAALQALIAEGIRSQSVEPRAVSERLRPHRLIHEMIYPPRAGLSREVVDQILENAAECVPLLLGTLRGWWRSSLPEEHDFPAMASLALLGEIGEPATLPALLEFIDVAEDWVRDAASWAVCRMAERHPAVMPALRNAIPGASASVRWGLALTLALMPGREGVREALLDLLKGLETVEDEENRTALFQAVAWALQATQGPGARAEVLALVARYSEYLDEQTRNACLLPEPGPFQPPTLTVYDHCCEPLDAPDEETAEEEAPPPRDQRPGRNDPCWCGSGRKYKKCHLAPDEDVDRHPPSPEARVREAIIEFVDGEMGPAEMRDASAAFFGSSAGPGKAETADQIAFMNWLIEDYQVPRFGRTFLEEFVACRGPRLDEEERRFAEAYAQSFYRLLEVQEVRRGTGVRLRDVLVGDEFFVHDVSSSRQLARWDWIFSRVLDFGDRKEFAGDHLLVPRGILRPCKEWVIADRQAQGLPWRSYLRANSHRLRREILCRAEQWTRSLQVATVEGDPVVFSKAVYEVLDPDALQRGLARTQCLDGAGEDFTWFGPAGEAGEARRVLGGIRRKGDRLILQCQSRERLERGRKMLEAAAPGALKHLGDEFTDWRSALRNRQPEPSRQQGGKALPPDVEEQLLRAHYDRHYRRWVDTPLPALDGLTPRQAAATPHGRQQVIALLKDLENAAEHARRQGRYGYDFSAIKAELGIDRL